MCVCVCVCVYIPTYIRTCTGTYVHYLCFRHLPQVLGIDVNVQDYVGMTPVMWAAFNNQPQNIQLLKNLGASTSVRDLDGMAAVHWAVHRNSMDSLQVCECVCTYMIVTLV